MAVEKGPKLDWGVLANSDLSAASQKFKAVKHHGTASIDAVVPIAAATDKPLGILNNSPKAGQEAEVVMFGVTKCRAGGAIVRGDLLTVDADGDLVPAVPGTDTTKWVIGRALESAADTQIFSAFISTATAYLAK